MEMPQPRESTEIEDTRAQKYFSLPKPKGCRSVALAPARISPTFSSTWLMTSVAECTVSANKVGGPVVTKPNSFEHMIRLFVAIEMVTDFDTSTPRRAWRGQVFVPECRLGSADERAGPFCHGCAGDCRWTMVQLRALP